ncbi:hypothetical protein Plhal304r1_c008g0031861 [Plasmopara halstedii]
MYMTGFLSRRPVSISMGLSPLTLVQVLDGRILSSQDDLPNLLQGRIPDSVTNLPRFYFVVLWLRRLELFQQSSLIA